MLIFSNPFSREIINDFVRNPSGFVAESVVKIAKNACYPSSSNVSFIRCFTAKPKQDRGAAHGYK